MKNMLKFLLTIIALINLASCKLPEQQLNYLKNKYLTELTPENIKNLKQNFKASRTIKYDPAKVKKVIDDLGFPESYNFFESTNATIHIKDQKRCGSCWSHSSTSALGYRFYNRTGKDLNLSPQNGLSCYINDCDEGNYDIDSALHLVKNGTVTEGCFPFVSGDGETMPECPTTCQDGSEYKKYYGKDAFTTSVYNIEKDFYEIVAIILDQIVNYGPVVSSIYVYKDFYEWSEDSDTCKNGVYTYDENSTYVGGHAVVLVGYGKSDDKYYWLLQNSWGEEFCDNGFFRVEMGQIGVEGMTFIEPYLPNEKTEKKNINLHFEDMDRRCNIYVNSTNDYKDWENTVEISFKNIEYDEERNFNMYCGAVYNKFAEIECLLEISNYYLLHSGKYKFVSAKSLGSENEFEVDESFKNLGIEFSEGGYCEVIDIPSHSHINKLSMFIILGLVLLL